MRCFRAHRVLPFIVLPVLHASECFSQSDGIDLRAMRTGNAVTLQWTGGSSSWHVYRSPSPAAVSDIPNRIAQPTASSYVDLPPAGAIQYYIVTKPYPKLIVRESAFAALRERAGVEPWASMKADAIATSNAGYVPGTGNFEIAVNLTRFASASALARILDEPNARLHATRVRDAILVHLDTLVFGTDWEKVVPPAHALFNLTLALDVVHADLTAGEIASCESKMKEKIGKVWTGDWQSAGLAAIGTWDLYTGARTTRDDAYRASLVDQLSADGVHYGGRCYGWARLASAGRYAKNMYMDVLEFTGVDRRYYGDSRIRGLYEWLYGASDAPFGGPVPFGDCAIQTERGEVFDEPPLYRAGKFGSRAGAYAAALLPAQVSGNLLSYIVPDGPLPPPALAGSTIFPDGGAFFREAMPTQAARPTAMGAALWNARGSEGHSHFEVNAVALFGYNEYLLVNSGYAGYGEGTSGSSWSWFHDDERSGNTLRTSSRHASKSGGGVVEGFTGPGLDCASGDDGPALPDDVHLRNMVFVHSDGTSNAYAVLFDEVSADNGEKILMDLHPNTLSTTGVQTIAAGTEYTASIDGVAVVQNRAKLSLFYATPPDLVRKLTGGIATWGAPDGGFNAAYLESEYTAPSSGEKRIVTLLLPHDPDHVRAGVTRLSVAGSTGARITHAEGVVDVAFESDGAAPLEYDGSTFTGKAMLRRTGASGSNVFYFVRKGTLFSREGGNPVGFSSARAVSVCLRGVSGDIVSPGTRVRFTYPEIFGVEVNGLRVPVTSAGPDWVEVDVPAGTHHIELRVDPPPVGTETNPSRKPSPSLGHLSK